MPSSPLESTHTQTTSDVACNHGPWTSHTFRQRRVCHANISLGLHTRSRNVLCGMTEYPLDNIHSRTMSVFHYIIAHRQITSSDDVGHGLSSYPLDNAHSRTKSIMTCHHHPWTVNTDIQCQALNAIIVFALHKWSDVVRRGMPFMSLREYIGSYDIGRGIPS